MKAKRILAVAFSLATGAAFATVNLNTAQQSELQRIRGLDKFKAKAIIEYRAQNGPFGTLEELEKVPGFTRDVVEAVKPELALAGDPFVPPPKAEAAAKSKPRK
jgi:competence protein ComEA